MTATAVPVRPPALVRICRSKRRYSHAAAIRAASRMTARAYGGRIVAYSCVVCGGWHVGHRAADRTTRRVVLAQSSDRA